MSVNSKEDNPVSRQVKVWRIVLALSGLALLARGAYGYLTDDFLVGKIGFLAACLIIHDGIIMPTVLVTSVIAAKTRLGLPLIWALIASAAVGVIAFPLVLGRGRIPDNPSAFPQDYTQGLLLTWAGIWVIAGVVGAVVLVRRRRAAPQAPQ